MFAEILVIDGAFERPVQINRAMILRCRPDWQYGGGTATLIEMVDGTSYLSHQTPEEILGKELVR